nr:MAG TPA: hypothetical protein [Caudoviricetes sp.]
MYKIFIKNATKIFKYNLSLSKMRQLLLTVINK